jgi:hypothetical protein
MEYLSTPLKATGWEQTLVNDSKGNTVLLMPNGHKGLEAVREATALFAAAPEMLAALCDAYQYMVDYKKCENHGLLNDMQSAIAKARGEVA